MADSEDSRPIPDTRLSLGDKIRASIGRAPIDGRGTSLHEPGSESQTTNLRARAQTGYPTLGKLEDHDPYFMIYRRFGWLHNRVLLRLQDDENELEEWLLGLDRDANDQLPSPTLDQGSGSRGSRKWLVVKTREKLSEYGESTTGNQFRP